MVSDGARNEVTLTLMDTLTVAATIVGLAGAGFIIYKVIQAIAAMISAAQGVDEDDKAD
jgi:threonine/homoserine/homoserine lactone efflux protein